jgi:signal transduction histidine kinase
MPDELGGLGIGLFLAREVVMRHGGSLTFESKEGEGSTFKVTLPLDKEYA